MAKLIRSTEEVQLDQNILRKLEYGEEIRPIPGYQNYFVTNTGRVFSAKYKIEYTTLEKIEYRCVIWKELSQRLIRGYSAVNITNDESIRKTEYVHYLVYEAFEGWVDRKVLKIVHIDKDKLNNNLNNLALEFRKKSDYQVHKNYLYRANMLNLNKKIRI